MKPLRVLADFGSDEGGEGAAVHGLWGRAFRPFFLALSLHGVLAVPWWTLAWLGLLSLPGWTSPMGWHGHEMLFGFVGAAIAGFLLTASPVWSGGPALVGRPLAALLVLWVCGRVAFALAGVLPPWAVAAADAGFLPAVALAVLRTLRGSGQRRNYAVVGVVALLAGANLAMHAQALGLVPGSAGPALRFAVDAVVVLLLVIGGRITPAFTRNALRARGSPAAVYAWKGAGALAIGAAVLLAFATPVTGRSFATGLLATLAGLAAAVRLAGWRSWHTRSDPLLWSLHLGAAWLAAGLLLVGASDLGAPIPAAAGLHALTAGAMGATILAVISRVGLGHTGRALELPTGVVWSHVLVNVAALARVTAAWAAGDAHRILLVTSGLAWAAAFGLYALRYAPILLAPRPDGRPG